MGITETQGPSAEPFLAAKLEYEEFLQSFPDVYSIRVDLGTYHALHKNYWLALREYQNAVKLRPDLALGHYYIGVTYASLGRYDAALRSFQQTLEIEPGFRNARELIEQVKKTHGALNSTRR